MIKKVNFSNKKFRCPHCEQTSNKKYNIKIHIQRIHNKMEYNKYDSQVYQNKIRSQNNETMPIDTKNSVNSHHRYFIQVYLTLWMNIIILKKKKSKRRKKEKEKMKEDTRICLFNIVNFVGCNII